MLLEKGAYAGPIDPEGISPIHVASRAGNLEMVKLLVDAKANVNAVKKDGVTPLHEAAAAGHFSVARYLMKNDADIAAKTVGGWTALHHAARFGHTRIASTLLYNGTPINKRTNDGKTIFDLAKLGNQDGMLKFLKKYARKRGKRIPRARKAVAASIAQNKSTPKPAKSKANTSSSSLDKLGLDEAAVSALLGM
jgi:ankyrin repeat protein